MRRGEEDELGAFIASSVGLFFDRRHVLAFAAIEDRDVRSGAKGGSGGVDGGIATTDDGDLLADVDGLAASYGFDALPDALDHLERGAFGKIVVTL